MAKAFQCPNCKNWYIQVPRTDPDTGEPFTCVFCDEGLHTAHNSNGTIDCHYHHTTATPSERQMAEAHSAAEGAITVLASIESGMKMAQIRSAVDELLSSATAAAAALSGQGAKVQRAMEWAGVMEMPGMMGEPFERRYKNIAALELLVTEQRRPPSDLQTLNRSLRNCNGLQAEYNAMSTKVTETMARIQVRAETWTAPQEQATKVETKTETSVGEPDTTTQSGTDAEITQHKLSMSKDEARKKTNRERTARMRAAKAAKKAAAVPA